MKKIPLSEIEKSFYYQTKVNPEDDSSSIVHRVVFDPSVELNDIRKAFCAIMSDYAFLRYSLLEEDGVPYFFDSNITQAEESKSLELLKRPFDLQQDILLRYIIDGDTIYIASHHIIFDEISWKIFITSLSSLLNNKRSPKTIQSQSTRDRIVPDDLPYWIEQLSGIERLVNIQKSSNHSRERSARTIRYQLEQPVANELRSYAKSRKVSLNTIFMYAVAVILYRLTEQQEMVISTPISTRELNDNEIHCDINVLPCPIAVNGSKLIANSLMGFSDTMWGHIEKRNFSLLELTKTLKTDHEEGLYNVMVEYFQKHKTPGVASDDLVKNKTPKLDLVISAEDFDGSITVSVEYDTSKVDDIFANTILNKIECTLDYIISNDNKYISDIELNEPKEIEELLLLGRGEIAGPSDRSIIDRFLNQVAINGDSVAIRHNGLECSYRELLERAERIASALLDAGISSQDRVGVHMERSIEYIATMLAIWILNAIYVPLDVNNPQERNRFFIRQAGIDTIVVNHTTDAFSKYRVVNVADIHAKRADIAASPIKLDDAAYIIFTSGSTGTPKGIAIRHDGFMNHLDIMIDEFSLNEGDVIAQTAPASFDVSVWQLTCALLVGATTEICNQDLQVDVEAMYRMISRNNISVLELVPSLLSAYLDTENHTPSLLAGLSRVKVITTGEAITNDIAEKWVKLYPEKSLINAYGPAEASDDTHFYDIIHDSVRKYSSIPIGKALRNVHTYILDADQKLSPFGLVGEIAIGGVAVADGYVGDKARTEAAFIKDSFLGTGRLYRTGDYGKWLPDGNLAYSGRRDNQIKIRGQRFELGEIENTLKEMTEVKDATAIVRDYKSNKRIVGFVSIDRDCDYEEYALKAKLSQRLPHYMIPWRIVAIPMIPRNNNGKTDRHKLADIAKNLISEQVAIEGSSLLSTICEVYSEVLGRNVSASTNYFDAGGDSLLSIKVVSRLRKRGVAVSVKDVITNQTPAELSGVVETTEINEEAAGIPDGFTSAIQQRYIVEAGKFADYGEIQVAVLKDSRLTLSNVTQIAKKISAAYGQLGMIELTDVQKMQSYDEVATLAEELRRKLKLHRHMSFSVPIKIDSELGILFIIHHYIFDVYSWGILRNDMGLLLDGKNIPNRSDTKLLQYWSKNNIDTLPPASNATTVTHGTKQHLFEIASLHSAGLVNDSLLFIYAAAKAIMQEWNKDSLYFGIERSARIDSRDYDLSDTIGWATYIKQVSVYKSDDFETFRKRYQLEDKVDRSENTDIDIVINYLGKIVNSSDDLQIVNTPIYRESPFVEIDIELNDGLATYRCQENIGLKSEEAKRISAGIESILNDHSSTNSLGNVQQLNILERVKFRAGRD